MKTKKIIAVVLSASMALSLAACSSTSKLQKDYESALNEIGYEEVKDDFDDDFDDLAKDGLYMSTNKKDEIEDFCDGFDYFDADDASSLTVGIKATNNGGMFIAMAVTFKDADAAEDFLDDMKDEFSGVTDGLESLEDYVKYETVDEDDIFQVAMDMEYEDFLTMEEYVEVKVDGKTATMVLVMASDDDIKEIVGDMEDFYSELGEDSPKELL